MENAQRALKRAKENAIIQKAKDLENAQRALKLLVCRCKEKEFFIFGERPKGFETIVLDIINSRFLYLENAQRALKHHLEGAEIHNHLDLENAQRALKQHFYPPYNSTVHNLENAQRALKRLIWE